MIGSQAASILHIKQFLTERHLLMDAQETP